MKKLFAILLACVMLLNVGAAMAEEETGATFKTKYQPVTPPSNMCAVNHTLQLKNADATGLPYRIEYSFTVSDPEIVQPLGITKIGDMVSGKPSISPIVYVSTTDFDSINKSFTTPLTIDWKGVEIKEPGIYRWKITKEKDDTDLNADPTNLLSTSYLFVYATDDNGKLTVSSVGFTDDINLSKTKPGGIIDQYPAQTLDLSITKKVTGAQGSRDQYFKFTIVLDAPAGAAKDAQYQIDVNSSVPETAYNAATTNSTTITADGTTKAVIWLRHDETATIKNLLYGTSYTITETEYAGYNVTASAEGDTDIKSDTNTNEISDALLTEATIVTFTNDKTPTTVPTGIDLQTGAPIMGLLLAASMLLMLFVSKRREAAE